MHCDVKIANFCKRSYQPVLRYLYAEKTKRWGNISLHTLILKFSKTAKFGCDIL